MATHNITYIRCAGCRLREACALRRAMLPDLYDCKRYKPIKTQDDD